MSSNVSSLDEKRKAHEVAETETPIVHLSELPKGSRITKITPPPRPAGYKTYAEKAWERGLTKTPPPPRKS